MNDSKEKSVEYLRGAAQALHDEILRLRQEHVKIEARLAEMERLRVAREAQVGRLQK